MVEKLLAAGLYRRSRTLLGVTRFGGAHQRKTHNPRMLHHSYNKNLLISIFKIIYYYKKIDIKDIKLNIPYFRTIRIRGLLGW